MILVLAIHLAGLVSAKPSIQTPSDYPWLRESWDSRQDAGDFRAFRLQCEDLKWGLKQQVDVPDLAKIDALFETHLTNFKKLRSRDNTFFVLCLFAHFGDRKGAAKTIQIDAVLRQATGYRSYEFSRVAYVAHVLGQNPPLPASDLVSRLFAKRKDDPFVMTAQIQSADMLDGYKPEHEKAVEYAKKLYDMFPERRERYRVVLVVALETCWLRSGLWGNKPQPKLYARTMTLIEEALADKQTSESDRRSVTNIRKFMENMKTRVDGG